MLHYIDRNFTTKDCRFKFQAHIKKCTHVLLDQTSYEKHKMYIFMVFHYKLHMMSHISNNCCLAELISKQDMNLNTNFSIVKVS